MDETLAALSADLDESGSQLAVCDAAPDVVLPAITSKGDIVVAVREVCTEELEEERNVAAALAKKDVEFELLDAGGITTIFGASDLKSLGLPEGKDFPEEFQVFYSAVRNQLPAICRGGLGSAPSTLPGPPADGWAQSMPGIRTEIISFNVAEDKAVQEEVMPRLRGGEREAYKRLSSWLRTGGMRRYKATFRHLLGDYSSRLSAYLTLGCVSPRRVAADAITAANGADSSQHIVHFLYELCWRDFFRHAARRWGASVFKLSGPLGLHGDSSARKWRRDKSDEDSWRRGKTGVPLVDAAMRELLTTGHIGNLARQFTAAFLVEELGLDWRVGADWFESALTDYDPHSNWGQWARSAGVAPTNDAKRRRVGGTRYYDLALRLGSGEVARYVRLWMPELASIPEHDLLCPWRWQGVRGASLDYPLEPRCSAGLRRLFEGSADGAGVSVGSAGGRGRKGGGRGSQRA